MHEFEENVSIDFSRKSFILCLDFRRYECFIYQSKSSCWAKLFQFNIYDFMGIFDCYSISLSYSTKTCRFISRFSNSYFFCFDQILVNGPGTCIPIIIASLLLSVTIFRQLFAVNHSKILFPRFSFSSIDPKLFLLKVYVVCNLYH